jgi:hypothetical protein
MSSTAWARRNTRLGRRDGNEAPIVAALRAFGASVEYIGRKGVPDLLVGFRGSIWLLEVKRPGEHLRDEQETWHRAWQGKPAAVVESPEQALRTIGAIAKEVTP